MKRCTYILLLVVWCAGPPVSRAQSILALDLGERYVERFADNAVGMENSQVWDIEEGVSGFVFAATNDGIAMFDGVRWRLYATHNESAVRALHHDKISGKLYSCGVNTFGYWTLSPQGDMEYTPLFRSTRGSSEDFWKICCRANDTALYFQTHASLYRYIPSTGHVERVPLPEGEVGYVFAVGNDMYIQVGERLCMLYDDGRIESLLGLSSRVVAMFPSAQGLVTAVEHQGLFLFEEGALRPVDAGLNARLAAAKTNCCVPYMDGCLLGTTKGGFIVVDPQWRIVEDALSDGDLASQTVLSLAVDSRSDIWMGFNSGIARVDISSNEQFVFDRQFGQVECMLSRPGLTLVATNRGLFEARDPDRRFTLVEGSLGATWKVMEVGAAIYVLHDRGLFLYEGGRLRQVCPGGVIDLCPMQQNAGYYVAGNYGGLTLCRVQDDRLVVEGRIEGFNSYPSRLTVDRYDNLWVAVQGLGFQRMRLSADGRKIEQTKNFDITFDPGSSKKAMCITQINGEFILYANNRAYCYDQISDTIFVNEAITGLLAACGPDLLCVEQRDNRLWYLSSNDAGYLELVSGRKIKHSGIFGQNRKGRITPRFFAAGDRMAVGLNNCIGFAKPNNNPVRGVVVGKVEAIGTSRSRTFDRTERVFQIPFSMNNLRIYPVSVPRGTMVDYRVSGVGTGWTTVKLVDCIWISALPPGSHTVEIRPSGLAEPDKYATIRVAVARPWYASTVAIMLYAAVFMAALLLLRAYYLRMNRTQQQRLRARQSETLEREKLVRDKQIAELQKEQIQIELREKDKRLANITMGNLRRNNILNELKNDIIEVQNADNAAALKHGVQRIVRKINTQLSSEEDWERSENYFNTIYDGLLDRLRQQYPALTKTDLKLCVYIKLNHSTKEMAELMNISPRSIEMARYRLRKKLGLSPNDPIENILK